jgi:hypothetical protein
MIINTLNTDKIALPEWLTDVTELITSAVRKRLGDRRLTGERRLRTMVWVFVHIVGVLMDRLFDWRGIPLLGPASRLLEWTFFTFLRQFLSLAKEGSMITTRHLPSYASEELLSN